MSNETQHVTKTNTLAIVSLICSIIGIFSFGTFVFAIAGIICGHLALKQLSENSNQRGDGLAKAGLIIGYIIVGTSLLVLLLGGAILGSLLSGVLAEISVYSPII